MTRYPPRLPAKRGTQRVTPPLPNNQDDATSVMGWTGLAAALLILLLLLLLAVLIIIRDKGAGSGNSQNGNDMIGSDDVSGGNSVPDSGNPGAAKIENDNSAGGSQVARDAGHGGESSSDADEALANSSTSGNAQGLRNNSSQDDESVFESSGRASAPTNIPSGTIALGNITGTAEFFGVKSSGGPVSYVIDYSSSMQGGRFHLARNKLVTSVDGIRSGQKFNVFLYNHGFVGYESGKLIKATPSNKQRFGSWISQYAANGNTNPVPAVRAAVHSGTKNVFLLSDGEFTNGQAEQIIDLCRSKNVIVHTISLNSNSATLQRIAAGCRGKFNSIN